MTPQSKDLDYHRPNGKITCMKDDNFDVLLLEIELDDWSKSAFCVWQKWKIFRTVQHL